MNTPAVSVVISVKNRSSMLLDCFRGLAAQTLPKERFEVVVLDNCSSEDLGPVFEQARALGLELRTMRTTEDRGPAPARNQGVRLARGEFIAFTDSDCRPVPRWLEAALEAFNAVDVAMVSGPVLGKPEQTAGFTSKLSFAVATEHPTFPTANLLIRRDVFNSMDGFNEALCFRDPLNRATECADTDLAWRIIKKPYQRRFVPEAVVYHELEEQGLMMWMLEPTRLFCLPELVRRHPELRRSLLTGGVLFYPPGLLLYLGLLLAAAIAWFQPLLLALVPLLLVLRAIYRTRSLHPGVLLRFCARAPLHALKLLVMNLSLLYGSVRFRSLVL
ncbi:MAG: glycosyltransferase [Burkholderiales bacterium]|nr:MAG: glycosyltransferase [Burkholderiales bacterium]